MCVMMAIGDDNCLAVVSIPDKTKKKSKICNGKFGGHFVDNNRITSVGRTVDAGLTIDFEIQAVRNTVEWSDCYR